MSSIISPHENVKYLKDFPDFPGREKLIDLYGSETVVWPDDQAKQLSYAHPGKEFLYRFGPPANQQIGIRMSLFGSNS